MVIPSLLHVSYCYIKFNIGIVTSEFNIFQLYGHTLPSTCFLLLHQVQYWHSNIGLSDLPTLWPYPPFFMFLIATSSSILV